VKFQEDAQNNDLPTVFYEEENRKPTLVSLEEVENFEEDFGENKGNSRLINPASSEETMKDVIIEENKTSQKEEERRYPDRDRRKPQYLGFHSPNREYDNLSCLSVDYCYRISNIPSSYNEAMSSSESLLWQEAMNEEMSALINNNTFINNDNTKLILDYIFFKNEINILIN